MSFLCVSVVEHDHVGNLTRYYMCEGYGIWQRNVLELAERRQQGQRPGTCGNEAVGWEAERQGEQGALHRGFKCSHGLS